MKRILKVYRIFNTIENKWIFNSNSSGQYINRVKLIRDENEQSEIPINSVEEADAYILNECSQNLSLD